MVVALFDSHCHLTDTKFDVDREAIINKAETNGLFMITVGPSYEESVKAVALANKYPKNIWATVGIHPEYASEVPENIGSILDTLVHSKKVVAVGEGGLDYTQLMSNPSASSGQVDQCLISKQGPEIQEEQNGSAELTTRQIIEKQKKLFKIQLDLALKYDLPIIMHLRNKNGEGNGLNAYKDALGILDNLPKMPKGVVHFFQGNLDEAQEFLKRGFYLGFDGYITFDNRYDKLIQEIPLERILVETDAPYVAPVPFRGQRNEPKFVEYMAKKISMIKNINEDEVAAVTYANTRAAFKL
ncbi:MAG TPA: TatD family hydrolase [Candidatus Paceibacterota bacterium]|nr:TatD family hydrolase [Candidatus Paceibacterota bacterium]